MPLARLGSYGDARSSVPEHAAAQDAADTLGACRPAVVRVPRDPVRVDAALLTVVGALLVALLASRSNARIAADNRSWDQRSEMYLAVIRWLAEDLQSLRDREPYRTAPLGEETRLLLHALGSEAVERRLMDYERARRRALRNLEQPRRVAAVILRMRLVHQQVKAELGAPMGVGSRLGYVIFGSALPGFLLSGALGLAARKRWGTQLLYPPTN